MNPKITNSQSRFAKLRGASVEKAKRGRGALENLFLLWRCLAMKPFVTSQQNVFHLYPWIKASEVRLLPPGVRTILTCVL